MLIMPCHLALNSKGSLVGARSATTQPDESWACLSCGCRLILHPGGNRTHSWFEHDQRSAKLSALMYCQYRNHHDGLPGERFRVMLYALHEQNTRVRAQSWFCIWCGSHYDGDKHCAVCNTGIYSTEETTLRENYTCPVDCPGNQRSHPRVSGGR